jgi:hypothetical protein
MENKDMQNYSISNYLYYARILKAISNEEELIKIAGELANRQDIKEVKVTQDSVMEDEEIIERVNVKMVFSNNDEELTITVKK